MPDPLDISSTRPSRPGLSPGAWAAVSAIVVALIGAGVTLTTTWWSQHRATAATTPSSAPQASPTPATAQERASGVQGLVGRWSGLAQGPGQPAQRIEVEILASCGPGVACGWITVPDIPCRGRLSLLGPTVEGLEFQVDGFEAGSDPKQCQPGAGEVLRATDDGGVAYTATYSGAKGVLRSAS
ncbi:hypothetical protein [Caulobacter sp. BK020]|uniref:hypothetical protein n=1 Tax=Caulobacter sp. BK020 TaxID=2512117 RepID=UPI001051CCF7|nr:hypothetical protein [Caulobacter sp. BK020]TCS16675.1 hypothetical protein EV278_103181 [Caulobacter sp. BK020]